MLILMVKQLASYLNAVSNLTEIVSNIYFFVCIIQLLLNKFDIQSIVHCGYILIIKQRDALISQIYFWNKTLHVSDSSSVHHQESSTVYTAIRCVIQVMLAAC